MKIGALLFFSAFAFGMDESPDTLARDILDVSFAEACVFHRGPLHANHTPKEPFSVNEKKIAKRREVAHEFDANLASKRVDSPPTAIVMEAFLNQTRERVLPRIALPLTLVTLNQETICREEIQAKFGDLLAKASTPEKKAAIERTMSEQSRVCAKRSVAYANFSLGRIYAADGLYTGDTSVNTLRIILLHELCHVAFPGVGSQSEEEIFCDAVAFQWARELGIDDSAATRAEYGARLTRNNPFEELLTFRAQLAEGCR